jgi:hypothetical protein
MTKPKAATLSTEVQGQAPAAATPAPAVEVTPTSVTLMPPALRLFGPVHNVLAELVVHARLGYHFDDVAPVDQFLEAGTLGLYLKLGTPSAGIVKLAQATVEAANAQQRIKYAKDVQEAARSMIEADQRAVREAEVAADIAARQAQIAALQASLTA